MEANSEDPESLKKALEGAYGVYAVTNYWEVSDIDKEIQQVCHLHIVDNRIPVLC